MNEAFALHRIICDDKGEPADFVLLEANAAFERLTGLNCKEAIGKRATQIVPGIEKRWIETFGKVALTGKPARFQDYSSALNKNFDMFAYSPESGYFAVLFTDVSERTTRENELQRLNRTLQALRHGTQAMSHAVNEQQYLEEICSIVVQDCGYAMVWIGLAEQDEEKTVRAVAQAGFDAGYVKSLRVKWDENDERGRGPTGTAIRTGKPYLCRNMLSDPRFLPWRQEAERRGYASSACFPLTVSGKTFGAISIYSREPDGFSEEDVALLSDLADELAHGIESVRVRLAREMFERMLRESEERYRGLVESSPGAILVCRNKRIVFANAPALSLLGAEAAKEVIGLPILDVFTDKGARDDVQFVLRGNSGSVVDERIRRLDGGVKEVEVSASAFSDSQGPATQVILHDVTERVQAEMARDAYMHGLNCLVRLSAEVLRCDDREAVLKNAVDAAREITGARIGTAGHLFLDGRFRIAAASRAQGVAPCPPDQAFCVEKGGVYLDLFEGLDSIRLSLDGLVKHPAWWGLPEGHVPLNGLLGVRLVNSEGKPGGMVMVSDKEDGCFTEEDESLLKQLAVITSLAMQHYEARELAQRNASELSTVLDSMAEGVAVHDVAGALVRTNPALRRILGVDIAGSSRETQAAELTLRDSDGKPLRAEEHPASLALMGEKVTDRTFSCRGPGGEVALSISAMPLRAGQEITGSVSVFHNITERIRAQEALREAKDQLELRVRERTAELSDVLETLKAEVRKRAEAEDKIRESEERYRSLFEAMAEGVVLQTSEHGIVACNSAAERILGVPATELVGTSSKDAPWKAVRENGNELLPHEHPAAVTLDTGKPCHDVVIGVVRKDNTRVWLSVNTKPILANDGKTILGVVQTFADISSRKRAEVEAEQLRQELSHVVRVATLTELSSAMAHELNQPLTAILSNAQAAQRFLSGGLLNTDEQREILEDIISDGQRAGEVIKRIRALSKKEQVVRQPLEINEIVTEALGLLRSNLLMHNIELSVSLREDLPPALGDRIQLQQIIINLVVNAAEAMGGIPPDRRKLCVSTALDGRAITVCVSDSGTGVPKEKADRIFEPFYTTKSNGMGMGLAICRTIIAAHGGRLWLSDSGGKGAAFCFTVPGV